MNCPHFLAIQATFFLLSWVRGLTMRLYVLNIRHLMGTILVLFLGPSWEISKMYFEKHFS